MTLTVGSLFSGIGGLDLGLERAGMKVIWNSEIEPYCCKVLAKHWPDVPNLGDVRTVDWSKVERPDLICGGYPCQPFSLAGSRRGEGDERHLWPAMRDAIGVLRPRFALLENVPGHLSLGFDRVLGDLADCGYDAEWDCIPAAAVGAPHLRYRLFIVAYADTSGRDRLARRPEPEPRNSTRASEAIRRQSGGACNTSYLADTDGPRLEGPEPAQRRDVPARSGGASGPLAAQSHDLAQADTAQSERRARWRAAEPRERGRGDGPDDDWWAVEPQVGRVAHGVPCRVDRLRALGNAVVPQVAEWIGRQLLASLEPGNGAGVAGPA